MLKVYEDFYRETLAIPAVVGQKTEKEKFSGAEATYTIEPMMHNGVALQGGTSHYFGDGFAKAFDITYTDRENKLQHPHQTSWGVSTRMIGAVIMVHGDDNGLVLPPKIAPIQVVIVPVAMHKPGVLEKAQELQERLSEKFRVKLDASDNSPGWKYAQYEMQGVPLRLEIGPKDIEQNQCVLVRRDNREKQFVSLDNLEEAIESSPVSYTHLPLDALHEILGLDILRVDGGGVADKAQHGAVGAHPGVHLHAVLAGELLDEFIHHFLFLMGFEYDNHGTSLPFTK